MAGNKLTTESLRHAGLLLAELAGHSLHHVGGGTKKQIYKDKEGHDVRLRTTNDRVLTVRGSDPDPSEADLDIDGCDFVLIVMPTEKRQQGLIEAYWVPTPVAANTLRSAHNAWLDSQPRTSRENRTFSVWFDTGVADSGMLRDKWRQYRIPFRITLERLSR